MAAGVRDHPAVANAVAVAGMDPLTQAMKTFRRIRPQARLGFYKGAERDPDADVLFASIQTLGRREHLRRFDPQDFDYVIVDEFHHAAAQTYRRVIGFLEPKFLLGLTAIGAHLAETRRLNPELQTFDQWLERNKERIPRG